MKLTISFILINFILSKKKLYELDLIVQNKYFENKIIKYLKFIL